MTEFPDIRSERPEDRKFHRFMQELMDRSDRWANIDIDALRQLAFYQFLLFGSTEEMAMAPKLGRLYSVLVERAGERERLQLLDYVTRSLSTNVGSVDSLLPFIFGDPEVAVVSGASFALAVFMPLQDGDPMTGPGVLRSMADSASRETARLGMLKGLLLLGDRRTLPFLDGCWETIGRSSRTRLADFGEDAAYASQIDFLLGWMERTADMEDVHIAGEALAGIPIRFGGRNVIDVERKFPADASDGQPAIRVIGEWTFREYGERIESRLTGMMRQKPVPAVIPKVLRSWRVPTG